MTTPHLPSPAEVASKQFTLARRGFDPDEVRAYLTELSRAIEGASTSLVQAQDQLALQRPGEGGAELRGQLDALQSQVRDLGNRLTVANALRDDALAHKAELQKLVSGLDSATLPMRGGDDLDRASNELAEVLRDAKLRAAQIKADAERDASLIVERARRDSDQLRISAQLQAEQATVRLQERLAELCREAEARVVVANTEAARILAESDELASQTLDHAQFQARRLVANAGTFTAIWIAESEELSAATGGVVDSAGPAAGRSVVDALAAFDESVARAEADAESEAEQDEGMVLVEENAEDPHELLRQADQLLSIAEVVRRAEVDHAKRGNGSNGARPA